jgi:hypothetical protein
MMELNTADILRIVPDILAFNEGTILRISALLISIIH